VNPASRLYRDHPEWVVSEPTRDLRKQRSQLVLDLCRTDVEDFARSTVLEILDGNRGISFVKWDANRDVSEPGSSALPADRQGNLWVDTVRARWRLMAEIAERRPDVELMLCASGGGRTDLGTLRYFHEVWLSDNTEAEARVRMQWAAGHFLPPQILAAHVTRWDGAQDLAFAAAVAMSARFGFDLDPATLTPADAAVLRGAADAYRRFRDLVQHGDLYRLVSPEHGDGSRAALMFAEPAGGRAVVFAYQLTPIDGAKEVAGGGAGPRFRLVGLTPDVDYQVTGIDLRVGASGTPERRSGDDLLAAGLDWPLETARTAAIWELSALRSGHAR
jgi:alpha-galactosidase